MNVQEQIDTYIAGQPEPKRSDLQSLHLLALQASPACKLWFNDGKNSEGKNRSDFELIFDNICQICIFDAIKRWHLDS